MAYSALGFRFFRIIYHQSVNIFTWDQWGLNDATLFQQYSLWEVFRCSRDPIEKESGESYPKVLEPLVGVEQPIRRLRHWDHHLSGRNFGLHLKKRLFGQVSYSDVTV